MKLAVAIILSPNRVVELTCRVFFSDPSRVNTLVEVRSIVVDVQHIDGHINWPVHNCTLIQCLNLETMAAVSSRKTQICACNPQAE